MRFTVVIPVYNEASILREAVLQLTRELGEVFRPGSYEICIVENGSKDGTLALAQDLAEQLDHVQALHCPEPDYGAALKMGIINARGRFVVGDEIDLCDVPFYVRALHLLEDEGVHMVVGSKALPGSGDNRPVVRKLATRTLNSMLRALLGFKGTDTHGLKVFNREVLLPVVGQCVVGKDLFASELVIRAERAGLIIMEIPVSRHEKRPPAINLFRRVPGVLEGLYVLFKALGPR